MRKNLLYNQGKRYLLLLTILFMAVGSYADRVTKTYYYFDQNDITYYQFADYGYNEGCWVTSTTNLTLVSGVTYEKVYSVTVRAGFANYGVITTATLSVNGEADEDIYQTDVNTYQGSRDKIQLSDYTFTLNEDDTDVQITLYANNQGDFLIESVTVEYEETPGYGISLLTSPSDSGVRITTKNAADVLNDGGSVKFDGVNTLILNDASFLKLMITDDEAFPDGLNVYLKGVNNMNYNGAAFDRSGAANSIPLTFMTDDLNPGTLNYSCPLGKPATIADAFTGFTLYYKNQLTATLTPTANQSQLITITTLLPPIITKEGEENEADITFKESDFKDGTEYKSLVNFLLNGILFTIPGDDDGFLADGTIGTVAINSVMSQADVNTIAAQVNEGTLIPCTEDYAEIFRGLTFLLPAGSGTIEIKAKTNEAGVLNVKIGNKEAHVYQDAVNDYKEYEIPYACTKPTYVFIYNTATSASRIDEDNRAPGKKMTTTTGLQRLKVRAQRVSSGSTPPTNPVLLTKESIASQVSALSKGDHLTIYNTNVTGLADDVFEDVPNDITYIDLSNTRISDVTVDRTAAPFKNIPDNVFIYMPVGNLMTEETDNVIIGTVCPSMQIDAINDFEVAYDFTAEELTQGHYNKGEKYSVCFPYAIDTELAATLGVFYTLTVEEDNKLKMTVVPTTEANQPYMFKATADAGITTTMVDVKANSSSSSSRKSASSFNFMGTYKALDITSGGTTKYYIFDQTEKLFKRVETSTQVAPFSAYLKMNLSSSWAITPEVLETIWSDEEEQTGIGSIKISSADERWYNLNGQSIERPLSKGVYIHQGRRVLVK